jgi:hypothetical protein
MQVYIYGHFVWGMSLCTFQAKEDFRQEPFGNVKELYYEMEPNSVLIIRFFISS